MKVNCSLCKVEVEEDEIEDNGQCAVCNGAEALEIAKEIERTPSLYRDAWPCQMLAKALIEMDAENSKLRWNMGSFCEKHAQTIEQQSEALREARSLLISRQVTDMLTVAEHEWLAKYSQLCGE